MPGFLFDSTARLVHVADRAAADCGYRSPGAMVVHERILYGELGEWMLRTYRVTLDGRTLRFSGVWTHGERPSLHPITTSDRKRLGGMERDFERQRAARDTRLTPERVADLLLGALGLARQERPETWKAWPCQTGRWYG